jgi:hypothetical protein
LEIFPVDEAKTYIVIVVSLAHEQNLIEIESLSCQNVPPERIRRGVVELIS